MNRGIWLWLEVAFDTLMFAPYLLRGNFSSRRKVGILLTYFRLSLRLLLIHPFRPLTEEKVFGFTIRCFNYRTMHLLFRVIHLRNEYYFKTSKARPVILDCGANIGLATLFFKWLYPQAVIYAFEPDIDTFALLKRNVEANSLTAVHLYNVALSDKAGTAEFHVDHANPGSLRMSLNYQRMPKDTIRSRSGTFRVDSQRVAGNRHRFSQARRRRGGGCSATGSREHGPTEGDTGNVDRVPPQNRRRASKIRAFSRHARDAGF